MNGCEWRLGSVPTDSTREERASLEQGQEVRGWTRSQTMQAEAKRDAQDLLLESLELKSGPWQPDEAG